MKLSKKRMTGLLTVVMALAIMVTSLAIFTDRSQSTANVKAGTLDLVLTQSWAEDNAEVSDSFAPGDVLTLKYTLKNDSTLAAKVREFFVISSDKQIPVDTFRIYKLSDLTKDADTGCYIVNDGASYVGTLDETTWGVDNKYYVTYSLPQFVLDGTDSDQKDVATATPNTDTDTADKTVYANNSDADQYVILFNKAALNEVQGAKIGIEYIAEAMQHSGTGDANEDDLWATVCTEDITFTGKATGAPELTFDPDAQNP